MTEHNRLGAVGLTVPTVSSHNLDVSFGEPHQIGDLASRMMQLTRGVQWPFGSDRAYLYAVIDFAVPDPSLEGGFLVQQLIDAIKATSGQVASARIHDCCGVMIHEDRLILDLDNITLIQDNLHDNKHELLLRASYTARDLPGQQPEIEDAE